MGFEVARDLERVRLIQAAHLARARWLRDGGYKALLSSSGKQNPACRRTQTSGTIRFMKPSKSGTVKAVSPCAGL